MKWKVGDRVSMLSRVNRRRLEPECVRILTVAKVTATQIVLEDGSRYTLDGSAIGKSLGQIRKATPADEAKIAEGIQKRRRSAEEMANRDQERRRILSLFPVDMMPSVSIQENIVELTFNVTIQEAEKLAKLMEAL